MAMKIKDDLQKHGSVKRGWLGVRIQDVGEEHAKSFNLPKVAGVLIAAVEKDSPAEKAGMQIGDIILKFGGTEISGSGELVRAVTDTAPGTRVKLQLWREGAAKELEVTLGNSVSETAQQRPSRKVQEPEQLGMGLRELSREEQKRLNTEAAIIVESVTGKAAESGIQEGDLIVAVNSKRVSSMKQFREALSRAGNRAALLVQRNGNMMYVPIRD
jgi:serine protease Do